ncbi:putative amylosucrase [Clavibacter sepedonicus]|uniref:Amylosucrase n=1 Tax=Clavibacter sepedonicus TaxID=31964 RepID=B0RDR4_CLASE|nr:putative amylosucrase [Clavibacter sepedonicus]
MGDDADALADALAANLQDVRPRRTPALGSPDDLHLDLRAGGVCYVDRYADDLRGLAARIPALRDLGLTHLQITPVTERADDADADADALLAPGVRVRAELGSAADLAALADALHDAGLTLAVDLSPVDADAPLADRIRSAVREAVALAAAGADVVRVDPAAVIGERPDAERAALLRVIASAGRRVAPALALAVAADADPRGAAELLDGDAVRLADDPALTALVWEALATRSAAPLSRALVRRGDVPAGSARTARVRSHDALRFAFDDDDARALGIDPDEHRRFLADYHVGRFPGSHARGIWHPDGAVAGTTASLAGLEQDDPGAVERILLAHSIALSTGGLPLLVLGDEVGQLNDYGYDDVPAHADDSRWVNRPLYPFERYDQRDDRTTSTGVIHAGVRRLLAVRRATPALGGTRVVGFDANDPHVLGYQRPHDDGTVLVLANLGDEPATVSAETLGGFAEHAVDLVRDERLRLTKGVVLSPRTFVWLQAAHDLA